MNRESLPHCRKCQAELWDDEVVTCPQCGHYTDDDPVIPQRQPHWVILTAVLILLAVLWYYLKMIVLIGQ
jgi:hypothetical protein